MKSPERILRQWVTDEISFKISGRRYVWTRRELQRFVALNFISDKPRPAVTMPDGKVLPVSDYNIVDAYLKLKWKKYRHLRDPRNFARFYSLEELADHLDVQI